MITEPAPPENNGFAAIPPGTNNMSGNHVCCMSRKGADFVVAHNPRLRRRLPRPASYGIHFQNDAPLDDDHLSREEDVISVFRRLERIWWRLVPLGERKSLPGVS